MPHLPRLAAAALLTALIASPARAAEDEEQRRLAESTYRLDPVHTQIWFSVSHLRFSNPQGRLRIKEGWFQFDPEDWEASRADVTIDLASVDMGDAKWNDAIKSGQFFDVERWPTARFVGRKVDAKSEDAGVVHGDLTLHGVTRPVDLEYKLNRVGNDPYTFHRKAGFSARATIRRGDFGMKRYEDVVGETIELRIEVEGIRDRDAASDKDKGKTDGA